MHSFWANLSYPKGQLQHKRDGSDVLVHEREQLDDADGPVATFVDGNEPLVERWEAGVEDGLEDVFLDFLLGLVGNVEEIAQNQQAVVDRVHVLFGGREVVAEIDDADVVKGGVKYKSLILEPKICLLDKA